MAEVIESSGESTKFLALHRSAAVGSLLQVKNPQNGQSVYVRVIGKLPPTGANENVIIRLSKRALQKLQVVDQRFRVEVSYMP
jgi:rare lipoprotein A (peptidoglycan hydrolase)